MASIPSDEPDPIDYINSKLNVFQVIQLYLINDIYENHEGIYSILYNIINDIKLTINLKELNQNLSGFKPKEEDLEEIIFTKLQRLKIEIREKNSSNSKFRNKHFESVESSSAESNTNSPPKMSPKQPYRLSSSSLKPKPQFKKKEMKKEDEEHFEIFNLQKRKRQRSTSPKLVGTSPKDFFEGKVPRARNLSGDDSSVTTEDSLRSSNLFPSSKPEIDDDEELQGEVIFEPWAEETIELSSTPAKKIKVENPPTRQSRKGTNPRKITPAMLKKKRKRVAPGSASLRRSPRKHNSNSNTPVKERVIVIDESPATKTIGLISSERRSKAEMNRSRRKLELEEPDMVEIGNEILDSEDTDPEDDVPLANLQPILANTSQIKSEKDDPKTPEPSKKLKKKKEEFFTISSVIKPPSEVNKRSRRSPVKSPQGIHDRYRATTLSFSHMLNSDYVPPAADDEKLNSPTKTPQKPSPTSIEPRNLSSSMTEDICSQASEVPALEDLEDETLAVPLVDSSDEVDNDEEAQILIRQAEAKKRAKQLDPPVTPKKVTPKKSSPRKTPRKTPNKIVLRTPVKTPKKTPIKTPMKTPVKTPIKSIPRTPVRSSSRTPKKTPVRTSPRKTPRKSPGPPRSSKVDENKNEKSDKKKKKKKKTKKKLNLRALAAAGSSNPSSSQESKVSDEETTESDEIIIDDKIIAAECSIYDEPDLTVEGPQVDIITTPDSNAETDSAPETLEIAKPEREKTKKVSPEPRKSSRVSQRVQMAKKETLKKKAAPSKKSTVPTKKPEKTASGRTRATRGKSGKT